MSIVRLAFYGTGRFARNTHIPNVLRIPDTEIVALCDQDPAALEEAAALVPGARVYVDADALLAAGGFDALYSCIPAFARTDVEERAVRQGAALFSEKPQAIRLDVALRIDAAVREAGVLATVGFRERYRPLVRKAREHFAGRRLIHAFFLQHVRPPQSLHRWYLDLERSGGHAVNWGGHALDQIRFITGAEVVTAQAFYGDPTPAGLPETQSLHFFLAGGGTATLTFVVTQAAIGRYHRNELRCFHPDGVLALDDYDALLVNGERLAVGEEFDPWLEQDRVFVEAVRRRDSRLLASDYADGIASLAPILAAWESARRGGEPVDVAAYRERCAARLARQARPCG
jgi:myo-inositol 2-dehydrogenase / D-chiro-inositol 1-dehydrogenase